MNRDNSITTMNVAAGFMLGMVAGVATGMLFAPKSGAEIRQQIVDKTKETADRAKNTAQQTADQTKQKLSRVADKTKSAISEGTRAAKEA